MSIRKKTLLAIGLTSLVLLVVLLSLVQLILLNGFNRLQEESVQRNMLRVRNVIASELDSLSAIVGDWAYWDDTYQYIQDKNQDYLVSNLNDESISNLKLNLFLFIDMNNQLVFGKRFDLKENQILSLPDELLPNGTLLHSVLDLPNLTSNNIGILLSEEGPMLVAARPILTSQRTGPMQGKLVFGQLLDEAKIAEFAKQTELSIAIHLLNSTELPSDFAAARASLLSSNSPEVVYTMQNQTAEGYSLLYDINGKPVMIMEIGMPNAIYQQGQQTVFYFAVALLIAGLTFSAVVMWLLERIVMGRLGYLNKRVQEIASSNQLSERIFMEGTDELSSLANTINNSLAITENSRIELQQLNSLLEEKVNDLNTMQTYRDHFFTNAAHEFRTPMAILRTQLYLAEKQPTLWQKHIDILSSATNQLSDILTDVFDMAQFKRQSGTLYRQEFEFKSLVAKIIAEERQYVYQKGIKLATELPDYNVYIQGDQGALENALEKLMHFIINYSAKDSQINVILATKSTVDSGFLELECSSLGLLLSASDLPHIFLPFYKSSEGNIRNTGLQLSVAKEIIDLHKGQISAYEDSQKGICFNIQLLVKRTSNELIAI